jgi:DNA-binding transcriptional MocR family regulator
VIEHNGHAQVTTDEVAASLGLRWVDGPRPLYEKLARSLQSAVDHGYLPGGTYLPSERALARALFVSRGTVVAAYRLLRAHGVLASQQGSGTWVRGRAAGTFRDEETLSMLARDPYLSRVVDASPVPIDLTLPAPRAALEEIADSGLLEHIGTELMKDAAPLGYQPRGLRSFRRALERYLDSRGLPTSEDEILITNGGQQAIALLLNLFLRPNDEAIVENPSYRGLIDALLFSRARVLPLAIEHTKLPSRLHELATGHTPRLIYLTPTCHNPTGSTLDTEIRREVVRIAAKLAVPLIEDTVLSDLSLQAAPTPLAAYARSTSPVIVVGSLSKIIWGGLRIGWIRAPSPIISRLARLKALADMGTSAVSQIVALELLANLEPRILEAQRQEVKASLALVEELLATYAPDWQWRRPEGGRSIWIRLPQGDGRDFAQLALLHGVAVSAGPTLSFEESFKSHIRVQFVQPPEILREGCWRLGDAWNAYVAHLA